MKKSTILLLVIVYIASFFVIGLLGASIKNYNPVYEPESIELSDPDNKAECHRDVVNGDEKFDYYFVFWGYTEGASLRIKAAVKPDNSSYPNVDFAKDAQNTDFNMATHATDEEIEEGYAVFTLNVTPNPLVAAKFTVTSQNPGVPIKLTACVVFSTLPKVK